MPAAWCASRESPPHQRPEQPAESPPHQRPGGHPAGEPSRPRRGSRQASGHRQTAPSGRGRPPRSHRTAPRCPRSARPRCPAAANRRAARSAAARRGRGGRRAPPIPSRTASPDCPSRERSQAGLRRPAGPAAQPTDSNGAPSSSSAAICTVWGPLSTTDARSEEAPSWYRRTSLHENGSPAPWSPPSPKRGCSAASNSAG